MFKRYSLQANMGLIILVFILTLGISVYGLSRAAYEINSIADRDIEVLEVAQNIQFEDLTLTDAVRGIIIDPNSTADIEIYNAYAEKIEVSIQRMMEIDPASIEVFDQIDGLNTRLIELETQMIEIAGTSPEEAVAIYKGEYTDLRHQLQSTMEEFVASKKQSVLANAQQEGQNSINIRNTAIIVGLVAVFICILISVKLLRGIVNPLRMLANEAVKIAEGDLTAKEIKVKGNNEVGQLAKAFNTMFLNLKEIIQGLNEKSHVVASSAAQLSASAENVSAGANETASSIHEVAATVEQVTQNSQKVADASNQADIFAKEGNDGIKEVTLQMETIKNATSTVGEVIRELNQSNIKISQIVNLITQIADQTNLLALNAAIEAARAGDQGRGFAVVAEEVRKLAEQSADAAKEIYTLINTIQKESEKAVQSMDEGSKEVEYGTKVVSEVGGTFEKITSTVQKLVVDIQDIASAATQMSDGVQNVAAAAQEQTATMEEVTSTTQDLASLAGDLEDLASKFRLS